MYNILTPTFKNFLYTILTAVRLEQPIGIFYDCTHIVKENRDSFITKLAEIFETYFNITFFTDFVPGFLTNSDGITLLSTKPNFTFVIFLNYDHQNPRQRSLLDEFIKNKHEYILFSPYEMDIIAYVPYIFLQINLNDMNTLFVIINYFMVYLKFHINSKYHNIKKDLNDSLVNYSYFYLILLFLKKKSLKDQIKIMLKKKKNYMLDEFQLLKVLMSHSTIKKKKFNKFLKYQITFTKFLTEYSNTLKNLFKNLFKKFQLKLLKKFYPKEFKDKIIYLKKKQIIKKAELKRLKAKLPKKIKLPKPIILSSGLLCRYLPKPTPQEIFLRELTRERFNVAEYKLRLEMKANLKNYINEFKERKKKELEEQKKHKKKELEESQRVFLLNKKKELEEKLKKLKNKK